MPAFPRVFLQQRRACDEIGQRRGIRGRRLRALACGQVEYGQLFALVACLDQLSATVLLFFFQAEDGIRDLYVTGVQTCALPILSASGSDWTGRPPIRSPRSRS